MQQLMPRISIALSAVAMPGAQVEVGCLSAESDRKPF